MNHEFLINKDDYEAFYPLIPEMYREELEQERLFGVASFDGIIDEEHLVGVVLTRIRYQWQEIVWVALSQRYSFMEYGADLIRARVEDARNRGFLFGSYSEFPTTEILRREYFSCAGFSHEVIPAHIYTIYTAAFAKRPVRLSPEEEAHCSTLRNLTPGQKKGLEDALAASRSPIPLEFPLDWNAYDWDASVCYLEKGLVKDAIFIKKLPDFYSMEGRFGNDSRTFPVMLEYLRKLSPRALNKRPVLVVPAVTEGGERMLDNAPLADRDALSLMCRGYENVTKRRAPVRRDLKGYSELTPQYLLGIDMMELSPSVGGSAPKPDGMGLDEYFDEGMRKKCAVSGRFWEKMEAWCVKEGLPSVMLMMQKLARNGYRLVCEGKAVSPGLRELGFTKRPLSYSAERARMTAQSAGLIVLEKELRAKLEEGCGSSIRERAQAEAQRQIADTLREVAASFFALTGKNIYTGEEIPAGDRLETAIGARAAMARLNNLTLDYDSFVTEAMIAITEEEADFQTALAERLQAKKAGFAEEEKALWEKIRKTEAYEANRAELDRAMAERRKLCEKRDALAAKIEVLCERTEFAGRRELIEGLYFYEQRKTEYDIDSIRAYLQNRIEHLPMPAMAGIYIRANIDPGAVCPDPKKRLDSQIARLAPEFEGISEEDRKNATVFLAWERMQRRTRAASQRQEGGIRNRKISLDEALKQLKELEAMAGEHKILFRELTLPEMFVKLPELVALFDRAKSLREAASVLLDAGLDRLDERYELYQKTTAIYDTLFYRARHIVMASRMTISELTEMYQDYHSTDYAYCYERTVRMSEGGAR